MNQDNITDRVSLIISELTDYAENRIDVLLNSNIIQPYIGSDDIRLIIIGQDPTVKNINSRKKIETTLNLDKKNALASYISRICNGLGLSLSNVYATNLFKYFYTNPPASTMNVLYNHIQPNLELLREELNAYPSCPIITLGEPLLKLLTNKDENVRNYWDYHRNTGTTGYSFLYSIDRLNSLERNFFPFPHQPSMRKKFYNDTFDAYIEYVKRVIDVHSSDRTPLVDNSTRGLVK